MKQEYKNVIVFVDEAILISTKVIHKLTLLQQKLGFRLLLTCDNNQLISEEAGKHFKQITKIIKPVV